MGKNVLITCALSGKAVAPVVNDLPDSQEGDDPHVPPGWLEVRVRRVVVNLEHEAWLQRREGLIQSTIPAIQAQATAKGETLTPEQAAEIATESVDPILAEEPAGFVVEEIGPAETPESEDAVFYLDPDFAWHLAKLGGEFEEAFGAFRPATVPSIVPSIVPAAPAPGGSNG